MTILLTLSDLEIESQDAMDPVFLSDTYVYLRYVRTIRLTAIKFGMVIM